MAQNGKSNRTGLPHGMVPFHQIADPQLRETVMRLNENVTCLARRVVALEKRIKNEQEG